MIGLFKRLFGVGNDIAQTAQAEPANSTPSPKPQLEPIPDDIANGFLDWYRAQRRPAIALKPDINLPIEPKTSRLFGPAFLLKGEEWPQAKNGKTLDFLAQMDLADCAALKGYPASGIIQFFIGRDDLFGADFEDLLRGDYLVRHVPADADGNMREAPHKDDYDQSGIDDFSPAYNLETRLRGISLVPEMIEDMIDLSHFEASKRFFGIPAKYDLNPLYNILDKLQAQRSQGHHTGGYPAFVQTDIREYGRYLEYDHVLLRLTSDEHLMWGDVGECVFMIPSEDVAKGDFSRVIYTWDCS